jgi:hypothetical protein
MLGVSCLHKTFAPALTISRASVNYFELAGLPRHRSAQSCLRKEHPPGGAAEAGTLPPTRALTVLSARATPRSAPPTRCGLLPE